MEHAHQLGIQVVLSGQGGDELLCGYRKYLGFYIQHLLRRGRYGKAAQAFIDFWRQGTVLAQFSLSEAKRYFPGSFRPPEIDVSGEALQDFKPLQVGLPSGVTVQDRQMFDLERFSLPVVAQYEDRMSMAWSREVRHPFLDHRLIETFIPLPMEHKLNHGWTKYIFRKALEVYLPKEIVWRKDKQGFINPQSEWLKRELRERTLSYFGEDSLIFTYGIIDRNRLLKKYDYFCRQAPGKGSIWYKDIFNPLALEIWLRRFAKYISKQGKG